MHRMHVVPFVVVVVVVLIATAAIAFLGVSRQHAPAMLGATIAPIPQLATDLYPLYNAGSWSLPESRQVTVGTTTFSGVGVSLVAATSTMNPASAFTPFENYYDQKLKALGYTIDQHLAAGGHVGGQTAYRKGGVLILTGFHIDYHTVPTNAPSTCPCDVTLSLFSATSTP